MRTLWRVEYGPTVTVGMVIENGIVVAAAPWARTWIGQPLARAIQWMERRERTVVQRLGDEA